MDTIAAFFASIDDGSLVLGIVIGSLVTTFIFPLWGQILEDALRRHVKRQKEVEAAIILSLSGVSKDGFQIMCDVEQTVGRDVPTALLYHYIRELVQRKVIEKDFFGTKIGAHPKYRLTEEYASDATRAGAP